MIDKVNLAEKFSLFADHWSPRIVGEVNDAHVKLAKFQGEFIWHSHAEEDELFLVVRGSFTMKLRDGDLELNEGEMVIIPRGVEHMPVAKDEVWVLLFEPKGTLNTGGERNERTVADPLRI